MQDAETNQSESLLQVPKMEYSIEGNDRVLAVLIKELNEVKSKLHDIETRKIMEETGLSHELLQENSFLPEPPPCRKRGKGYRPILKSEILEAKKHAVNEAGAARFLKVNIKTYRKYAMMYGIYDPKPNIRGQRNIFDPHRGKYPLHEILEGKYPDLEPFKVKDKLIRSGLKKAECEQCGFNERRIVDNKIALILNFMDDNSKNHRLDNMKLYCLNCTFVSGRGYIRNGTHRFDPDYLQGATKHEIDEEARY